MFEGFLLAQSPPPTVDAAYLLALLSRVVHTTCAATLLGGAIYLRFVLGPAAAAADDAEATLFAGRRKAWAACVGLAAGLLLVSGFYNYAVVILNHAKMNGGYHGLIGLKILLALVVLATSALIAGKSGAAVRVRQHARLWLNICVASALAIFVLGATAKSYPHLPKTADAIGAAEVK